MKKSKNTTKTKITPNPNAAAGIPAKDPHAEFIEHDASFKKSRGAQK